MLVMSRRQGETILIGDDIEIVIAHIGRSRVKVGIRAPRQMPVVAREMKLVRDENLRAAGAHPVESRGAAPNSRVWGRQRGPSPGVGLGGQARRPVCLLPFGIARMDRPKDGPAPTGGGKGFLHGHFDFDESEFPQRAREFSPQQRFPGRRDSAPHLRLSHQPCR